MTGKNKNQETTVDILFKAYKLGGIPLYIVTLGTLCLLGTIGIPFVSGAVASTIDPYTTLIVGVFLVLLGTVIWVISFIQHARQQAELTQILRSLIQGAARVSADGSNYQVALDKALETFPKVCQTLSVQIKNS